MGHRFAQITASVPGLVMGSVGLQRTGAEIEKLPESDEAANAEDGIELVIGWAALHGRQRPQIRHQVLHILGMHMREAPIWKHRIIVASIWRHATQQRIREILRHPVPDAVDRIRRDVGRTESSVRRCKGEPATEMQAIGLSRRSVAGGAIARRKYEPTPLGVAAIGYRLCRFRGKALRRSDEPHRRDGCAREEDSRHQPETPAHPLSVSSAALPSVNGRKSPLFLDRKTPSALGE